MPDQAKDKFKVAILGLAVGDALGFPIEFMPMERVHRLIDKNGITDFTKSLNQPVRGLF